MVKDKPRLSRLAAIITQLQSKRLVTAKDIADKHQVSIRTVYRDIRTLEKSGIPIVTEEGRGYSMMDGYKLPPIMFTEDEAIALITAEQLISKNKDQSLTECYSSAVMKIKSILKNNQKTQTELIEKRLQVRNNTNEVKTSTHLIKLQKMIAHYQLVEIDYLSLSNHRTRRLVEPFALYTTKDNWVLIGYCRDRQDFRAFRLDCIQNLQVTGVEFEPHDMTLEQYLENCRRTWQSTPDIPLSQGRSTFALNQKNKIMQTVAIEQFNVIGLSIKTSNTNGQALFDIGQLWGRFLSESITDQIPNKVDDTVYSLYTDYEGDHTKPYTVVLGCKVTSLDSIPADMVGRSFEGGSYATTSTKGDLTSGIIGTKWGEIWKMNLDRTYTADFEVYGAEAMNPKDAKVDFFVAVKP